MPTRRQGPGLGLAVPNDAGGEQLRVVKHRAVSVGQRVAQFAALVDGTRRLRRDVAGNAAGKGELFEQFFQTFVVLRNVRIDFAVGAFEVSVGDQARTAVPRTGDVNDIQIVFFDNPVEVNVNEVQSGRGAPMTQQARLDVFALEGPL